MIKETKSVAPTVRETKVILKDLFCY